MLYELYVKNLALIDEIRVSFSEGFHVLTGETGAGKSIILGSINLALGAKYSADMLRKDAEYGYVELTFLVQNEKQRNYLKELDVFPEEDMVILSRKLLDKRSICKINGETVSLGQMKEVAALFIDIHGQHEHQSLLYKKNHISILDAFAKEKLDDKKEQVAVCYKEYKKIKTELENASVDIGERDRKISFLEFEIEEIKKANIKPSEDVMLEEEYRRMVNGKKIVGSLKETYAYTGGMSGDNASEVLSRAIRALSDATNYDAQAETFYQQLAEIDSLLNDFNRDLSTYSDSFEFSEEEFYEVETRLNELNRLKSKYGNTIEDVLNYCEKQEQTLEQLQNYEAYLSGIREKLEDIEKKLRENCSELTTVRRLAGRELEQTIKEHLQDLNFLDVQFEIAFHELENYTANGMDEVEFLISMNPGEPVRALGEVASGGELSRIMLAIKTVMAEKDEIETLIFDEIDVGISGRTAQKVSEKMALIGKHHQVICITHLAQIAAMADVHYAIEKNVEGGITKTTIKSLNKEQEIVELARILGGAEITETVMKSAAEMKELASVKKKNIHILK